MECEPSKVKVVLVASGSIKSNIYVVSLKPLRGLIEAQTYKSEDSFYKSLEKQIKHVM